jgi:hypothetical protein
MRWAVRRCFGVGQILARPLFDGRLVRCEDGCRPRFTQLMAASPGIGQGRRRCVARVMRLLGDLTLTLVLEGIRAPNAFFVIHLNHPSSGIPTLNIDRIPELWGFGGALFDYRVPINWRSLILSFTSFTEVRASGEESVAERYTKVLGEYGKGKWR